MRISFAFYGDVQLDRTLARVGDNVDDLTPVWYWLAESFQRAETRQFNSEGAFASGGWSPLSPRYARWKARHYPGTRVLERTGALRKSLTTRPFGVEVIENKSMAIGSDVDYGRHHQRGGAGLPQRRPVELTENMRREWMRRIQRFVITGNA
ncbi:phage virion morphogenesis protein [Jiangella muralis]|uniref:phage virion morphogenesis protein n=1 Tax=Jiangella muralis TaxID=702383 RepID=UPI00069EC628|nr:phage virion morphogenesis protein [Jiangella muralis]